MCLRLYNDRGIDLREQRPVELAVRVARQLVAPFDELRNHVVAAGWRLHASMSFWVSATAPGAADATMTMAAPSVACGTPTATASATSPVAYTPSSTSRRAHPISRGLDHLVATPDEIEETFRVATHGVARPHREFGEHEARVLARNRLVSLGGLRRIVPVAERHQRAAMHELARLIGRAVGPVRTHDEDLRVRNRLADRFGTPVDFRRIEIGRAERLRQAVHQERRRPRQTPREAWRACAVGIAPPELVM